MTTEACVVPRLKEFKFRFEINGLAVALVKEFNPGKRTHGVTEHAGAGQNFPCKEAGMLKYENAVLKTVVPVDSTGRDYFEEWANLVQDPKTGNGMMPALYKRVGSLYELKPTGEPSRVWMFYGMFPVDYDLGNRSSESADKDVIEEIHFAYSYRTMKVL